MRFAMFSKHLQDWPLHETCQKVKAAGFDGLDLTVRPGGYVDPTKAARDLPAAVKVAREHGLEVPLITTGLLSAEDPAAEATLMAAGEAGIKEAKLHYWPLATSVDPRRQVNAVKPLLNGLAKLAEKSGVRVNLHNHSGDCVTHSAWVVRELVEAHPPSAVGVYFDPAHYLIEGGIAGWWCALEMLAQRVSLVAVKDTRWVDVQPGPAQERRWVPVGTGNVLWKRNFSKLKEAGFDGWMSIHGEYQGRWSYKDLGTAEVLEQGAADRAFIQGVWGGV